METNKSELSEQEEQIASQTELPQTETEAETDMVADTSEETSNGVGVANDAPEMEGADVQMSTDDDHADDDYRPDDHDDEDVVSATDPDDDDNGGEWFQPDDVPSQLKRGQLITGKITQTSPTTIHVDVGAKTDGVVPGRELERMTRQVLDSLRVGEEVAVYVVNPNDHNGNILLSINRAMEELDWQEAEVYRKSKEVYEGHVGGYNKGGLIVRFGRLRGFVPQSQVSDERRAYMTGDTPEERYGKMVNDTIGVKVMEVDRSRNRLILSERAASRELREKRKAELIHELTVGEVRDGVVVSLEDFGAFVDVGGAEGLVHLTELSWKHVNHPREVLRVGAKVRVEVISIDPDRKRIGLSVKRQLADPWDEVASVYNVGQLVEGVVTKLTKFGAFSQLADAQEIEGLIHISELSDQRINHPREVVNVGDKLTLRVVKIDVKNRRLGLSLKRVNSAEYLDLDWAMATRDTTTQSQSDEGSDAADDSHGDA